METGYEKAAEFFRRAATLIETASRTDDAVRREFLINCAKEYERLAAELMDKSVR